MLLFWVGFCLFAADDVFRVQHFVRPVAVGLVEILLIQSLDVGVLVRFTQFHTLICVIYGLCAFCANVGGISRISVL